MNIIETIILLSYIKNSVGVFAELPTEDLSLQVQNATRLVDYLRENRIRGRAIAAYEGSVARLPCGGATENGTKLTWTYAESINNFTFKPMEEKETAVDSGNLTIYYMRRSDGGLYQCNVDSNASSLVVLQVLNDEDKYDVSNVTDDFQSETNNGLSLKVEDIKLFQAFPGGIPCRSDLLPTYIIDLPAVRLRRNEIMIGLCKVPCKSHIFEVRSPSGEVVERANNSEGVYSLHQKEPPQPPPVARDIIFATKGAAVLVKCPGTTLQDIPVTWRVGNKEILPRELDQKTDGRMHLNARDHIVIAAAEWTDSNVYSCWQDQKLAGVIKLKLFEDTRARHGRQLTFLGLFWAMCLVYRAFDNMYRCQRRRVL